MEEILHQLRLVVYPIIYRVSHIPGGDRRISAINSRDYITQRQNGTPREPHRHGIRDHEGHGSRLFHLKGGRSSSCAWHRWEGKKPMGFMTSMEMILEKQPWMKMYFLLNMGIFQPVMLVSGSVWHVPWISQLWYQNTLGCFSLVLPGSKERNSAQVYQNHQTNMFFPNPNMNSWLMNKVIPTVDGSEIRHQLRLVVEIYHDLQGFFKHPRWWSPDFSHQQ